MAWVLTRGLTSWRAELDEVFPGRDKRSSGSIGDQAHAGGKSGHNPDRTGNAEYKDGDAKDEVRAVDEDRDLVPGSGTDWMELVVQYVVKLARAGGYVPFRYIIYKRRIWSAADGWKTRTYSGANAHGEHAHFSGGYSQKADEWTGRLGVASIRKGTTVAETNGWQDTTEHGDGREVTNETALQNLAELFRLLPGNWTDWWFVRWVTATTAKIDEIRSRTAGIEAVGANVTAARQELASVRAELALARQQIDAIGQAGPVQITAQELAVALLNEISVRRTGEGQ